MALRYFVRQAVHSMRLSPVLQAISVGTIAVSMLVLAGFVTLTWNVDRLAARWSGELRLIAFLADDARPHDLDALAARVGAWPEVQAVRTQTRAQSWAAFRTELGPDEVLLAGVDESMMPATVEITPVAAHAEAEALAALGARVRAEPLVGELGNLDDGRDLVARLNKLRDGLQIGGFVLAGLVALSVVFIIANTVRLGLYARRDEVEVMQLVGATDHFVRGPFYVEGGLQGFLGAALAVGALALAFRLGLPDGVLTFELFRAQVSLPPARVLATLVAGATLVGVIASHVAVTRYLHRRPEA